MDESSEVIYCTVLRVKEKGAEDYISGSEVQEQVRPVKINRDLGSIDLSGSAGEKQLVRFHPTIFELGKYDGIQLRERLPELLHSVRLQRLRKGEYDLVIPCTADLTQSRTAHVCAIDPGVRNFVTMYDLDGRTFSVRDARSAIEHRFKRVDGLKAKLSALAENKILQASAVKNMTAKATTCTDPLLRQQRYRLQRKIRFTLRCITRMIRGMHHKVSSWLLGNCYEVLLPACQTPEMERKYNQSAAADSAATVQPAGARAT